MGLTQVSKDGVKNDAIDASKLPANSVGASELADNAVDTNAIADQAVALSKLPHGDGSSNGKFLRANNGADPSFESIPASGISNLVEDTSPQLGGELDTNGNDIRFADTDEAIFGNGADLKIYHEGGSGDNIIKNNIAGKHLKIQHNDGSASATFYNNSSVELYYAGSKKLETLSNGVRVQGGLLFGNDTAAANALDDYEEGTWTPSIPNGTLTTNGAYYTKVGRVVSWYLHCQINSTANNSSAFNITGLPYTVANLTSYYGHHSSINYTAGKNNSAIAGLRVLVNPNSTTIYFHFTGIGDPNLPASSWFDAQMKGVHLIFTGEYITAS